MSSLSFATPYNRLDKNYNYRYNQHYDLDNQFDDFHDNFYNNHYSFETLAIQNVDQTRTQASLAWRQEARATEIIVG